MDRRLSRDLDNYITGHYGEDQFRGTNNDPVDLPPEVFLKEAENKVVHCFENTVNEAIAELIKQKRVVAWISEEGEIYVERAQAEDSSGDQS